MTGCSARTIHQLTGFWCRMGSPQLVMCLHVVAMWCSRGITTQAAPASARALRNDKSNEISAEMDPVNVLRNFTMELRPRQNENWEDEEFLIYAKDVLAKRCPHKADNKTCANDDALTQVEEDFNKLDSTQQETIRTFMGGSRDTITCAQLVRIKVGSKDETAENVACVLYFYNSLPNEMTVRIVPPRVD